MVWLNIYSYMLIADYRKAWLSIMSMYYKSTRDDSVKVTASQAILKGLAPDGGSFVPSEIPTLDKSLEELAAMSYKEVAYEVMKLWFDDFTEEELKELY